MAYTNGIFYIDLVNGSDTARTALSSVSFAWNSGTSKMRATKASHGLVTGAVVDITGTTGLNAAWKITVIDVNTFDLDASSNVSNTSGTVTPRGGSSWTDSWKTITSGATSSRIAAGDVIRIAKSPDATSLGQAAQWTDGPLPSTKSITSSTNATPIVVTISNHGYSNGDVIQVTGHSTNTKANGIWLIANVTTNTFELVGSAGNGVGSGGNAQKIHARAVILSNAVTANIAQPDVTAWTAATNVTVTADSSDYKKGSYSMKAVTNASFTTGIISKFGLASSIDLSAYQQVSFWLKVSTTALASAGNLKLKLYSDSACTMEVESFDIPAIPSTGTWIPITINKGSALSSTVQGVALYANITQASKTYFLDCIIACKASTSDDSLTLQSLIGKNTANEAWYGIQSIIGRIVLLDNENACLGNAGYGYTGTTESVTTYKRETIKTTMVSSSTAIVNDTTVTGAVGNYIEYTGGWNTSNTTQDGMTFIDGLNGNGYGININTNRLYLKVNNIGFVRYYYGMYFNSGGSSGIYENICVSNCGYYGIGLTNTACGNNILKVLYSNNNYNDAINVVGCSNYIEINQCNNNRNGSGVTIYSGLNNKIVFVGAKTSKNNSNYGIAFTNLANNNYVYNVITIRNSAAINCPASLNYVVNGLLQESTECAAQTAITNSRLHLQTLDNTANNDIIYSDSATAYKQTSIVPAGMTYAWQLKPSGNLRRSVYPFDIVLARFAVSANTQVTFTANVYKSNATNIIGALVVKANQVGLTTDTVQLSPNNLTTWDTVTIQFTPTEAGVVEITARAYYPDAASSYTDSVYFGKLTFTQ